MLSKMKLGSNRLLALLRKIKFVVYGKQLNDEVKKLIQSIFLQALQSEMLNFGWRLLLV